MKTLLLITSAILLGVIIYVIYKNNIKKNVGFFNNDKLDKLVRDLTNPIHEKRLKEIKKEFTNQVKENKKQILKQILIDAMEQNSIEITKHVSGNIIKLKDENIRGRIIGKNGRNLRAIEKLTGTDLALDQNDKTLTVSSFNPIRREIAYQSIKKLIADGRIHPGTIEDTVEKVKNNFDKTIMIFGKEVVDKYSIDNVDQKIIKALGKLNFRYSYGQNVLIHSIETAKIASNIANAFGLDSKLTFRAGLLHDIGKALDIDQEGTHSQLGAKLVAECNENDIVINAIASHHGEITHSNEISRIVKIADSISASRPGARSGDINNFLQRVEAIEKIAKSHREVKEVYAIRGGKELRVFVKPNIEKYDLSNLANEIKIKIEKEVKFPGIIKITIIKENRFTTEAKQPK